VNLQPKLVPRGRRSTLLAVALAAVALTTLAACSQGSSSSTDGGPITSLTVGLSQNPDTLDPGATGLVSSFKVDAQIFDTLVYRFSDSPDWKPVLATDMTVNGDATVYTFTLRKDVTFQDGTPFTAAAVKATFDHIVDPATKSLSAIGILGPYAETKIVDDYTAEVVFSASNPAFFNVVSNGVFGISSPAALEKYGAGYGQHPVGTGPFSFESFTSDSDVKLVRNNDYKWGPAAYGTGPSALESLTFRILTDQTAQSNALSTGEIGVADNLTPQDAEAAVSSGKKLSGAGAAGVPYGYLLNLSKAPTDDVKVRQALIHAVDRKAIVDTLFAGQYDVASSVVTPATNGYVDGGDLYAYDPKLAGKMLDDAGWTLGSDGLRSKGGVPLTIDMIDIANFGFDGMSTLIQAQLAAIGVTANLSSQAFAAVAGVYNAGTDSNTASFFYWSPDPGSILNTIYNSAQIATGFNWGHYSSTETDTAIAAANATVDPSGRTAAFAKIITNLNEQAVYLPIYDLKVILVASPNIIKGVIYGNDGSPLYAGIGR
jgi:peptide/nickel transport system substrate-binding protein